MQPTSLDQVVQYWKGGDDIGDAAQMATYVGRALSYAFVFNALSATPNYQFDQIQDAIDDAILAVDDRHGWPGWDLFPDYPR